MEDIKKAAIRTTSRIDAHHSMILPMPPSANQMFGRTAKGWIYKTRRYRDWELECMKRCMVMRSRGEIKPLPDPCTYGMLIVSDMPRNRDLDNVIKPLSDLLVKQKLTPDDRFLDQINAQRIRGDAANQTHNLPHKHVIFLGWFDVGVRVSPAEAAEYGLRI